MAQKTEAGNVRAAVYRVFYHDVPGSPVQFRHLPEDPLLQNFVLKKSCLQRSGEDTDAEGFREDQNVTGHGSAVFQDFFRMDETGNSKAIDRFRSADGVAAGDDGVRPIGSIVAAPENLLNGFLIHAVGNAHDIQCEPRGASHGVNVGERVGGCDDSVEKGIIHNGREKVCGLDQCRCVVDYVDAGIVTLIVSDDQAGITVGPEALQEL